MTDVSQGRTLTIPNMQRSQAGIFTCHVEEGVGSPVRRHFTVTVKGKKRLQNNIEPYYFIHIDII